MGQPQLLCFSLTHGTVECGLCGGAGNQHTESVSALPYGFVMGALILN